jgi:hypothetical protein
VRARRAAATLHLEQRATRCLGTSPKILRSLSNEGSRPPGRTRRALPDRYKHVNNPKQRATLSGAGGATKVLRPNPAPLRVLGRRRRGELAIGTRGHDSTVLPPCRAAPLGCSATTLGACFIDPYQNVPTNADTHAIERRLVLGGARRAVAARRHHLLRREVAEVFLQQPRARRAEGLGRTTKQLGCVGNDGVVNLALY